MGNSIQWNWMEPSRRFFCPLKRNSRRKGPTLFLDFYLYEEIKFPKTLGHFLLGSLFFVSV